MWKGFMLFLLLASFVGAQEKYADLSLQIDNDGVVYITGNTNFDSLDARSTEFLTSKNGPYWIFNLTTKDEFSDYYISLEMPRNSEINYMRSSGSFRITEGPAIRLITSGEGEPIEIVVQYRIGSQQQINYPAIFGLIILMLLVYFIFPKLKFGSRYSRLGSIMHTLTDSQNKIISVLIDAKKPISQKQIQHRTGLPKATLSRNIELLRQKNIISKESRGMVNVISVSKEFQQ